MAKMTGVVALRKFFGLKADQTAPEFITEVKALDEADREELVALIEAEG